MCLFKYCMWIYTNSTKSVIQKSQSSKFSFSSVCPRILPLDSKWMDDSKWQLKILHPVHRVPEFRLVALVPNDTPCGRIVTQRLDENSTHTHHKTPTYRLTARVRLKICTKRAGISGNPCLPPPVYQLVVNKGEGAILENPSDFEQIPQKSSAALISDRSGGGGRREGTDLRWSPRAVAVGFQKRYA